MINAALELGRTVGFAPKLETDGSILSANHIVSGKYVKLGDNSGETVVLPAKGDDVIATAGTVLGIAADDTQKLPFNGLYEVIDNYFKNFKVAAFVKGGMFTVWNDGRGAVFASDVHNAAAGTPLYIGNDGALTKTAGEEANIGGIQVGVVLRAPASADGTLFFKADI